MTKKRILDVTTVKKRDTMLSWTNITTTTDTATYATGYAALKGSYAQTDEIYCLAWCPTARDLTNFAGNLNPRSIPSARTSSEPYMVGLAETINLQTTSAGPWQWRRICFTAKGNVPGLGSSTNFSLATETSIGVVRVVNRVPGNRNTGQQYDLFEVLFKGQNGSDWNDPLSARTDNSRVTIKYDRIRTIASGNQSGVMRTYKHYHPMRKTLVYGDDERGDSMLTGTFSTTAKAGMGDYYVIDLFKPAQGATATEVLSFNPAATLYWHEK